nr:OST-HTH/LOTUS domain-containing protein [Rhizobium ruizarguesonis]
MGQPGHRRQAVVESGAGFRPATFGFRKLSDLISKTNQFEVVRPRAVRSA